MGYGQASAKETACESERLNLEKARPPKRCFSVRTLYGSFCIDPFRKGL